MQAYASSLQNAQEVACRDPPPNENGALVLGSPGTGGMDGGNTSLAPTDGMVLDLKAMKSKDLQRLCVEKNFRANGTTVSMVAALEASMCSDVAVTGGGSAAEDDDSGMVLDFKAMKRKDLQRLCVEKNFRANVEQDNKRVSMVYLRQENKLVIMTSVIITD